MTTCNLNPHWLAEIGAVTVADAFMVYTKSYANKTAHVAGKHRTLKAALRTLSTVIANRPGSPFPNTIHAAFIIGPDGTQYNWHDAKAATRVASCVIPRAFDRVLPLEARDIVHSLGLGRV